MCGFCNVWVCVFLRTAEKISGRFQITVEIFLLKDLKCDNQ
jgi:hypothetical protein